MSTGRFAKIIIDSGRVVHVDDKPIQLLDGERGVFTVVEVHSEPVGGLQPGDIMRSESGRAWKDEVKDPDNVFGRFGTKDPGGEAV